MNRNEGNCEAFRSYILKRFIRELGLGSSPFFSRFSSPCTRGPITEVEIWKILKLVAGTIYHFSLGSGLEAVARVYIFVGPDL